MKNNRNLPDSVTRTLAGLVMMIIAVLNPTIIGVLLNLLFGHLLLLYYKIPHSFLIKKIKVIFPFAVFTIVFFPLYDGIEGLLKAGIYIGRLTFVTQMLTFMLYLVPVPVFLKSLYALKIPWIFIDLVLFTLRFIEVFKTEFQAMHFGLKSRGFFLGNWFSLKKYKILGQMIGVMLLRSLRRGERVYFGMISRGYSGTESFKSKEDFPIENWQSAVMVLCIYLSQNILLFWQM